MVSATNINFTLWILLILPFIIVGLVGFLIGNYSQINQKELVSKYLFDDQQEKLKVCTERQGYNFDAYMNASVDLQNCKEDLHRLNPPCKT